MEFSISVRVRRTPFDSGSQQTLYTKNHTPVPKRRLYYPYIIFKKGYHLCIARSDQPDTACKSLFILYVIELLYISIDDLEHFPDYQINDKAKTVRPLHCTIVPLFA